MQARLNLTSPAELRALFTLHGFRPKKRLGQHFLVDRNILDKIIAAAELGVEDQVLEIGAGAGVLTAALAQKAARVVALEVDTKLAPILEATLDEYRNVELVSGDVLSVDLAQWLSKGDWKVVANLPYYITSPIIARLLDYRMQLTDMVLMVQEEVGARLLALPAGKEYGSISILVQTYCEGRAIARVSRNCFYPRPEVDSAVIGLRVRAQPLIAEQLAPTYFKLVHAAFGKRRKMLHNALASLKELSGDEIAAVLESVGISPSQRGETLSPQDFARLAAAWAEAAGTESS